MTNPSPRDLDPKFKDATLTDEDVKRAESVETDKRPADPVKNTNEPHRDETPQETLARMSSGEVANDPSEGFIVHRSRYVDENGVQQEKVHGPMPVGEWAEYSRERGL